MGDGGLSIYAAPAGAAGQYQFNNGGAFGGDAALVHVSATVVGVGNADTGLSRNAASVLEVNAGVQGQSAGLIVGSLRVCQNGTVVRTMVLTGQTANPFGGVVGGVALGAALFVTWDAVVDPGNGTPDVGIKRQGVGTLEINSGVAGTLRDLTLRTLLPSTGAVAVSTPMFQGTSTWNAGGVAFTGILANVTNTASAATSLLIDLQTGGITQFGVDALGQLTVRGGGSVVTAGNFLQLLYKEENVGVANGVVTQQGTAGFVPAGAHVLAIRFKVVTQPGNTATFTAGTTAAGSAAVYRATATSTVAGTVVFGGGASPSVAASFGGYMAEVARTVLLTFNAATNNALGVVTVGVWYWLPTVA